MSATTIKKILENEFKYLITNFEKDKIINGHHEVYTNFEIDINTILIDNGNPTDNKEECIKKLNNTYFYNNQNHRIGAERDCSNVMHLVGHVVHIGEFIKDIQLSSKENANNKKAKFFDPFDLPRLKDELASGNITKDIFAGMDGYRIRNHQMWCFLNENRRFENNQDDLPLILALYKTNEGEQFLFFEIRKPKNVKAHKPTFFDAGFSEYWEPGGKTRPIGRCSGQEGLEEIMIEKLHLKNIISIKSLTIRN